MVNSSLASLLRWVERLHRDLHPVQAPREYVMCLEEGQEVSQALLDKLGAYDSLVVRCYPQGFLGSDRASVQHMACWLPGERGAKMAHVVSEV
jgi:hypothetical protein